jgi:hypothetical protein
VLTVQKNAATALVIFSTRAITKLDQVVLAVAKPK